MAFFAIARAVFWSPVIAAPAGIKSDYEIVQALAPRVNLNGEFGDDVETWKRRLLRRVADQGASLEDLRRGAVRNPLAKQISFEDRKFATPTGRVNLLTSIDVTPPAPTTDRPLLLMALSTEKAQGSQWVHGALDGPMVATVHPDAATGFLDGDLALVESEVGQMTVRLAFDARQRPDVLLLPKGGHLRDGRCANALIRAELTDDGGCAVYYDTPVRLRGKG